MQSIAVRFRVLYKTKYSNNVLYRQDHLQHCAYQPHCTRMVPDSHSINSASRKFDIPHCSYQESLLAQKSDHGEEIHEPDSVVIPQAHAVQSPSACAAVTVTLECHECLERVTIESSATLDAM